MKVTCHLNAYYNDNGRWRIIDDPDLNADYYAETYPVEHELVICRIGDFEGDESTVLKTSQRFIKEGSKSINVYFPGIGYTYNCQNEQIYCLTLEHNI